MTIRRSMAAIAGAALLTLAGCASGNDLGDEAPTSESSASSTTSTTSSSSQAPSTSETSSEEAPEVEPTREPASVPAEPAAAPPAVPTTTRFYPGEKYGEVCYSGTPDQWPNYVNPATGCGGTLNPSYQEPEPEPVFVECLYGGGSWTNQALFSDGQYRFHPECQALRDQQMAKNPYRCPQTDWYVPDPSYCSPTAPPVSIPEENQQYQEVPQYEEDLTY